MTKNEKDSQVPTTGHEYDGIVELDHPIPDWFRALFYGTIVFAAGYFFYYQVGDGPTLATEYKRDVAETVYAQYLAAGANPQAKASEQDLLALLKDDSLRKIGAQHFQAKCASCHGPVGQGGIGPNLTDKNWIHGAKMTQVVRTISEGVSDKGMPPWGSVFKDKEVHALAVYIRSLYGSNPPNPKAPQGEVVEIE